MTDFLFLTHNNVNPYFNLASEEYLLKQTSGFYFYLWINEPAVIVGINQNSIQEVNLSYTDENNIKVVRRLTGGGAVYHDLGNICYTVIAPYNQSEEHYKKFTAPIIEYLNSLGVNAKFSGRNDICIEDKKISGNAQTVYKDRIMHHGTILFDTDLSVLANALKPNKLKIQSKGIKSIRARVTNIINELPNKISTQEFYNGLCNHFRKSFAEYHLSEKDLQEINKLKEQKYSQFYWNIGLSPKGSNVFEGKFSFGVLTINFDIENGLMQNVQIYGDFFSKKPIEEFAQMLNGIKFNKKEVQKTMQNIDKYIVNANGQEITDRIFE